MAYPMKKKNKEPQGVYDLYNEADRQTERDTKKIMRS